MSEVREFSWSQTPSRSVSGIKPAAARHDTTRAIFRARRKTSRQTAGPLAVQFKSRRPGRPPIRKSPRAHAARALSGSFRRASKPGSATQQRPPVDARENTDLQQPVAQIRRRENPKRPAVETAVADQNQFARELPSVRADGDSGFCSRSAFSPAMR